MQLELLQKVQKVQLTQKLLAAAAARAASCGTTKSARFGSSAGLEHVHLQVAIP